MNQEGTSNFKIFGRSSTGMIQRLSQYESELLLECLQATYLNLVPMSRVKTKLQLIEITFDIARAYYDKENPVISAVFAKWWQSLDLEDFSTIVEESPDYLALVSDIRKRVDALLEVVYRKNDGIRRIINNEETEFPFSGYIIKDVSRSGSHTIYNWFKKYISTVGTIIPIQVNRTTSGDFIEVIDPLTLFYSFTRIVGNISLNDFDLLIWIIEFGDLKGNRTASAFRNRVVHDITGNDNIVEAIKSIRNEYINNYLIHKNPKIINVFLKERSYILQNILKGINIWIEFPVFFNVSEKISEGKKFNAYSVQSVKMQMTKWRQQYQLNNDVGYIENLVCLLAFYKSLEPAVKTNVFVLKKALGVDVSEETIRWLLINSALLHGSPFPLPPNEILKYELFRRLIESFSPKKIDAQSLLVNIRLYANKSNDIFGVDGIRSRLLLLAQINALFDESIIGI